MDKPLVSIIVPIYNIANYLEQCITSIVNQTYKNLEIILVDDGSTDSSRHICDEFKAKDTRIIVVHKQNGGVSSSREAGMNTVTGDYVMFVDGDDWIDETTVEECIDVTNLHPKVQCVFFSYLKELPDKSIKANVMDESCLFNKERTREKVYRRLFGLLNDELAHPERMDNIGTCCCKLYSSDIAKKGKYFETEIVGSAEDVLFNMYAMFDCAESYYLHRHLYHYRKNETSITGRYRPRLIAQWNNLFEEINNVIKEKNLPTQFYEALINRIALSIVGIGTNIIVKDIGAKQRIADIKNYLGQDYYQDAVNHMDCQYMSFVWRLFFFCCKQKNAYLVYLGLCGMSFLKRIK